MARIKVIVATGVPFADAVKASLGMSIAAFAAKHGLIPASVSNVINGSTPHPYERVRDALALELDVEREWLDGQLAALRQPAGEGAA